MTSPADCARWRVRVRNGGWFAQLPNYQDSYAADLRNGYLISYTGVESPLAARNSQTWPSQQEANQAALAFNIKQRESRHHPYGAPSFAFAEAWPPP